MHKGMDTADGEDIRTNFECDGARSSAYFPISATMDGLSFKYLTEGAMKVENGDKKTISVTQSCSSAGSVIGESSYGSSGDQLVAT